MDKKGKYDRHSALFYRLRNFRLADCSVVS
jgi:hypothetical protein